MSHLPRESMKNLSKQIMLADLASRKNKMLTAKGLYFAAAFLATPALYVFNQMFSQNGPICSITAQGGDPLLFYYGALGHRLLPFSAIFRPEIFYQDKLSQLDFHAEKLKEIIEKNDKIKFNSYVWH